jgi:hypothetical protein
MKQKGWGYDSNGRNLPSNLEALGSIPHTTDTKKEKVDYTIVVVCSYLKPSRQ